MTETTPKIGKTVVDRNLCIGAASCLAVAPSLYELDGENKAILKLKADVKNSGPAGRADLADAGLTDEVIINSAKSCPTRAIILSDEAGQPIAL